MEKSFHYLNMKSQTLFQKKVINRLIQTGLTPGQPKVLDYLSTHDGSMQKDIAKGCFIDPATLTGILERMEEKNLIERRIEKGNRRSSYVYLTENGKKYSQLVTDAFLEMEEEVFQGVKKEEREQFMNVLNQICCNMEQPEERHE